MREGSSPSFPTKKWNFNIQLRRHGRSIFLSVEEENSTVVAQPIWIGV